MKKSILTFIAFLIITGFVFGEEPVRLKVITYNLRFGELASLKQLGKFIKNENPDLVALQELDWMTKRIKVPHQHDKSFITELGYYTSMFPFYGKTIPFASGLYGIGILTNKPYISVEKIILPKSKKDTECRALLYAQIEITNSDTIIFASTHLDYTSSEARKEQIAVIKKTLENQKYPVLLGGDFNATPNSQEMAEGFADWTRLCNDDPTIPSGNPNKKIDFLLGFPNGCWKLNTSQVINTRLSDHLPVISEIELIKSY